MARIKINPFIIFVPGLVVIAVALIGVSLDWSGEDKAEDPKSDSRENFSASVVRAQAGKEAKKGLILRTPEVQNQLPVELSAAEKKAEMDSILLGQIRNSSADLDLEWLAQFGQYIRDEESLARYFDDILQRGANYNKIYTKRAEKRNWAPVTTPYYFLEKAKYVISSKTSKIRKMKREGRNWLALGYYKEHEKKEGWENIDELFLSVFFKERIKLFRALQDSALKYNRDPQSWLVEELKTYEAILVDRHLRTLVGQGREESNDGGVEGGGETLGADFPEREINETLIAMGKVYLNIAEKERADVSRLEHFLGLTFQSMAMVYQRQSSAEAFSAIGRINEIRRAYLYRMAQLRWRDAREAKKEGKSEQADEFYFKATQHYLQCISRWGESDRGQHIEEFRKLKREIALWENQKKESSGNEGI